MKLHDQTSSDPTAICNMFSSYFASVFEPISDNAYDCSSFVEGTTCDNNNLSISILELSYCDVKKALDHVDINKGAGQIKLTLFF